MFPLHTHAHTPAVTMFLRSLLVTLSCALLTSAQYVDVEFGTLNVIVSAPHGGDLEPGNIPDRTAGCWDGLNCIWSHSCGTPDSDNCDATTSKDLYTQELARELADELFNIFGERPTLVINLLHRRKMDANRDVDEASFGEPDAVEAWNQYHDAMQQAKDNFIGNGTSALVIDVHGHGHPNDWAELGYLLSGSELDNGPIDPTESSIRHAFSLTTSSFEDLLRGPTSFGASLERSGFWSVPGPVSEGPGGASYFSGGYITQRYGSRDDNSYVDAIQIESPRVFREDQRPQYRVAIAQAIQTYFIDHFPSS